MKKMTWVDLEKEVAGSVCQVLFASMRIFVFLKVPRLVYEWTFTVEVQ